MPRVPRLGTLGWDDLAGVRIRNRGRWTITEWATLIREESTLELSANLAESLISIRVKSGKHQKRRKRAAR